MKPQDWIRIIRKKEFIFVFFDVLLLTLPGVGALFLYDRDVFMSLDWARIILLGAALMAPLDFLNMTILPEVFGEFSEKAKDDLFVSMTASIVVTSLLVYVSVAIFCVIGYDARKCASVIIGMEAFLLIVAFYKDWRRRRQQEKKTSRAGRASSIREFRNGRHHALRQ